MGWFLFPDAFVSVVAHNDMPTKVVVRARLPGDIERLLPGAAVEKTPSADYLYRTVADRHQVAEVLAERIRRMTYTNVKKAIPKGDDTGRAFLMNRIWAAGLDAQEDAEKGTRYVDEFLHEDRRGPVVRDLFEGLEGGEVEGAYDFDADGRPVCSHFGEPDTCPYCAAERDVGGPNLVESRRRRERGMAQVVSNTDPEWKAAVKSLCEAYLARPAAARRLFTAEDLREYCEQVLPQPHHPNAWSANLGGLIRSWKSRGLIEQVGSQEARRPVAHARLMRCYRVAS